MFKVRHNPNSEQFPWEVISPNGEYVDAFIQEDESWAHAYATHLNMSYPVMT